MEVMILNPHGAVFLYRSVRLLLSAWMVLLIQIQISSGVPLTSSEEIRVLVLGDSLSAGYGLDQEKAFPALIERRANRAGWSVRVTNGGVSGDTTASGLGRIDWLLRSPVDVLLLELGANDGLRGVAPEATYQNLQRIIDRVRASNPAVEIIIAGMMVPPNMGSEYSRQFREIFPALAAENDLHLVPFLLEGVAGDPSLNLPDGIHPNPAGHRIVADNVWKVLEPILEQMASSRFARPSGSGR